MVPEAIAGGSFTAMPPNSQSPTSLGAASITPSGLPQSNKLELDPLGCLAAPAWGWLPALFHWPTGLVSPSHSHPLTGKGFASFSKSRTCWVMSESWSNAMEKACCPVQPLFWDQCQIGP